MGLLVSRGQVVLCLREALLVLVLSCCVVWVGLMRRVSVDLWVGAVVLVYGLASGYGSGDDAYDDTEGLVEVKKITEEREYTMPEVTHSSPVQAPPTAASSDDEDDDEPEETSGQEVEEVSAMKGVSGSQGGARGPGARRRSRTPRTGLLLRERGDPGMGVQGPRRTPRAPRQSSRLPEGFGSGFDDLTATQRFMRGPPGAPGPPGDNQALLGPSRRRALMAKMATREPQGRRETRDLLGSLEFQDLRVKTGWTDFQGRQEKRGRQGHKELPGSQVWMGYMEIREMLDTKETPDKGENQEKMDSVLSGPPGPPGPPGPIINLQELMAQRTTEGAYNFSGMAELQGEKGEPGTVVMADGSVMSDLRGPIGPQGVKGNVGLPGVPGVAGPVGPVGPKGEFGFPGRPVGGRGDPGIKGEKGEAGYPGQTGVPGTPGPPGYGRPGCCWPARSAWPPWVPLTIRLRLKSFSSREAMMQHTVRDAEGTLAFVSSTGTLFLKVSQGWKEIQPRPAYQIRGDTMQRIHAVSERVGLRGDRPQKSVWHGTATRGLRGLDKHCESWRTEHMSVTGLSSNLLSGRLLGQLTRSCTNQYIVLCIESHKST
ncbi:hypothetical protein CRUP_028334 [Coryphaenoides rupestris]|nr:hypothetical protein CRUP_028334 [Coryphaenoides rupestris]